MRRALLLLTVAACGEVKNGPDAPPGGDGPPIDTPPGARLPATPVAPTVGMPMYQGSQTAFAAASGEACTARVAASMGGGGFCFLAADDTVKCAGKIDATSFGMSFATTGQSNASQIMIMFGQDNGMCITKTDHTVVCMGSNANAFGTGGLSQQFTRWTAHDDIAFIASGTWDQICGITMAGQVFCGGRGNPDFGNPPVNVGTPGQTSVWVDGAGIAHLSDTQVLRPAESRTECQIKANGFVCPGGQSFGPTNGSIVMAVSSGIGMNANVCWLDTSGTVSCTVGPRFQPGKVLYLAGDFYSDSLCAIYNDGSVWCIGSNNNGKLGTGNNLTLTTETMVAPPGSAHTACD